MLYWVMGGMFEALFAFPQERVVILKERATASYRLSAYFCAMTTADMPVFVFMPFLFLVISYWMTVPTLGFTTFVLILLMLGGFFAQNLPVWLSWVQYISPFAYASNAALGVIFESPVPCDGSGGLGALCENGAEFASPADVLDSFTVTGTVWSNILCLLVVCVIPRLAAYYFLRRKKVGERE